MDGSALLRRGLTELINHEPDLTVCGEVAHEAETLSVIAAASPDLVIADLMQRADDDMELLREIQRRYPRLPVLVLSMAEGPRLVARALEAGATGYVSKSEMGEPVLAAIRSALGPE